MPDFARTITIVSLLLVFWAFSPVASCDEGNASQLPADSLLLNELTSGSMEHRKQAVEQLRTATADQLDKIIQQLQQGMSAEVVVHVLEELSRRYVSEETQDRTRVSELLESLQKSPRLMVADGATQILKENWRVRVELTVKKLETLGAIVRTGSFTSPAMRRSLPSGLPNLQIMICEEWKGSAADLLLLHRLEALTSATIRGPEGLFVWLLAGHTLNDEQKRLVTELVGPQRIYERSRVALGIRADPGVLQKGVLIGNITPQGSADDAGLKAGDILISILMDVPDDATEEERKALEAAQELRDFDDLVERLKDFGKGDVIQLKVLKGSGFRRFPGIIEPQSPPQPTTVEIVSVRLKGWEELPVLPE